MFSLALYLFASSAFPTINIPAPPPQPNPVVVVKTVVPLPSQLDQFFTDSATKYRVDKSILIKIADCESGFNPQATNDQYAGMFQYSASTWQATRQDMGLDPNPDLRFDPQAAIETSAWKIAHNGLDAWPVCGK